MLLSRYFRFRLRTLLVLVAVAAVGLGPIRTAVIDIKWVRDRREFRAAWTHPGLYESHWKALKMKQADWSDNWKDYSPYRLRIHRECMPIWSRWTEEVGVRHIGFPEGTPESTINRAKELFPEAKVSVWRAQIVY